MLPRDSRGSMLSLALNRGDVDCVLLSFDGFASATLVLHVLYLPRSIHDGAE